MMCITLMHPSMQIGGTVNAITLRNIPAEIREAVERRAKSDGLSFNRTVIRMLEELVSPRPNLGRSLHHDLDHLAGTWSEVETETFETALAQQRQIDPELWE